MRNGGGWTRSELLIGGNFPKNIIQISQFKIVLKSICILTLSGFIIFLMAIMSLLIRNQYFSRIHPIEVLEKFGDIGQYAISTTVGGYALLSGNAIEAIAMGVLGCIQTLEVFSIKKHFPRDRPQPYIVGKKVERIPNLFLLHIQGVLF